MASQQPLSDGTTPLQGDNVVYRPFDTLPPELLSYILTLTWLTYKGDDSKDRFRFPSILRSVNHFFNHVAMSTPTLWSYLRVTSVDELEHIEERIKHRSGALPLDIYLVFSMVAYEDAGKLVERTIKRSPSRFHAITLSYPNPSIIGTSSDKSFWDHLRLLNGSPLHVDRFSIDDGADASPLDFLPPFTSIRVLNLCFSLFNWSQHSFPDTLDALSIQESGGDDVSTSKIVRFFSGSLSRSLRSLTLRCVLIEEREEILANSCILESLEVLKLQEFYMWEIIILLSSILTPNLQHLFMNTIYDDDLSNALSTAWKAVRLPSLKQLTLQDFNSGTQRLIEFLPNLPNCVRRVNVAGTDAYEALLAPSTALFRSQLHYIGTDGIPLCRLVSLVEGSCGSLRGLEAAYRSVSQAEKNPKMREELTKRFGVLKPSQSEILIVIGEEDSGAHTASCMTFEEFAAFYKDRLSPGHSSVE